MLASMISLLALCSRWPPAELALGSRVGVLASNAVAGKTATLTVSSPRGGVHLTMREEDTREPSTSEYGRRTGRRVGGSIRSDGEVNASHLFSLGNVAGVAIALLLLKLLFAGDDTRTSSFSYTVSSYSETVVRNNEQVETKRSSSFKTNIPGLAERLAEEGKEPADMIRESLMRDSLFPF